MGFGTFGFKGLGNRGFDLPGGSEVAVGPEGRARLRYNEVADQLEVSLNAASYVAVGGGGSSPWTDTGTLLHPTTTSRSVVVGASALSGTEKLRVVGATLFDMPDNAAAALVVREGASDYLVVDTTNGGEAISIGAAVVKQIDIGDADGGHITTNTRSGMKTALQVASIDRVAIQATGRLEINDDLGNGVLYVQNVGATPSLSFFGGAVAGQQTVSGATGGNAALESLISALATYGLVIDGT